MTTTTLEVAREVTVPLPLEAYVDRADAMLEVYARPDAWEGTLRALVAVASAR